MEGREDGRKGEMGGREDGRKGGGKDDCQKCWKQQNKALFHLKKLKSFLCSCKHVGYRRRGGRRQYYCYSRRT